VKVKAKAKKAKVVRERVAKAAGRAETRIKKLVPTVRNPFAPMALSKRRRHPVLKRPNPFALMAPFSRESRKSRRSPLVPTVRDPNALMAPKRRRRRDVPRKLSLSVPTAPSSREDLVRRERRLLLLPPRT